MTTKEEHTLSKDGFQIIPLVQPCVFAGGTSFWNYLQSLPELDLSGLKSLADLRPGHLGLDPRGILPYASTFHHVFNRDIRAIAYLHAAPAIYEMLLEENRPDADNYSIEQLYDGFSVRMPGQFVPAGRKFREAKMALVDDDLSSRFKKKLLQTALKDAEALAAEMKLREDDDRSICLGEDSLDFETSALEAQREKKVAAMTTAASHELITGWVNLSFRPEEWAVEDLDYVEKMESLNQFLTYIPQSHLSDREEGEGEAPQRVAVPPNHLVLIHPRLRTKLVKGTIKTSFVVRQYVSFHLGPTEMFSKETRRRFLQRLEVPYLPSGHRPCAFRMAHLDGDYHRHFTACTSLLRPAFRVSYKHVANNYLYSLLEDVVDQVEKEDAEDVEDFVLGKEGLPPKVLRHLELGRFDRESYASHSRLFRSYTVLDKKFVNSLRNLAEDVHAISEDQLTRRVERMLRDRQRDGGFLQLSEIGNYVSSYAVDHEIGEEEEDEEEDEEEEEAPEKVGGLRRTKASKFAPEPSAAQMNNFTWVNDPAFLPLYRKKQLLKSVPAEDISLRKELELQMYYLQNLPLSLK